MKIEVNITKTKLFILFIGLFVLAGAIFAFAYTSVPGSIPNPGHSLSENQGYFQNDLNLNQSLGKFCQSDGTNCQRLNDLRFKSGKYLGNSFTQYVTLGFAPDILLLHANQDTGTGAADFFCSIDSSWGFPAGFGQYNCKAYSNAVVYPIGVFPTTNNGQGFYLNANVGASYLKSFNYNGYEYGYIAYKFG